MYLVLDVLFILLALSTYITIFQRYYSSLAFKMEAEMFGRRPSLLMTFMKSTFYIPIAMVTIFLLLMVTPDVANVIFIVTNNPSQETTAHIGMVLNVTSDIFDACLYIFLKKTARKWICGKFRRRKKHSVIVRSTARMQLEVRNEGDNDKGLEDSTCLTSRPAEKGSIEFISTMV